MSTHLIIIIVCSLGIGISLCYYIFKPSAEYPSLERKAELLALSNDVHEIKEFMLSKIDYLSDSAYKKLLARVRELNDDQVIYEDLLKVKIDTLHK